MKEIHRIGSGFLKAPWYGKFTQEKLEDNEKGIFAIQEPKTHAARRKLFANGFSKTALTEWEDVLQEKVDLTMEGLKKDLQSKGTANMLAWFTFMASRPDHASQILDKLKVARPTHAGKRCYRDAVFR